MAKKADARAGANADRWQEQLYRYAKDIHDLYEQEKKKRQALAEETLVVEYREKELSSLNRLFQQHLERSTRLEETLQDVAGRMKKAIAGSSCNEDRQRLQELLSLVEGGLQKPPSP